MPESFKVLVKELQALGLNIQILNKNNEEVALKEISEEEAEDDKQRIDVSDLGEMIFDDDDPMYDDEEGQVREDDGDEDDYYGDFEDDGMSDVDLSDEF